MVVAAVRIARACRWTVKVLWTRERGQSGTTVYRPVLSRHHAASLSEGKIVAGNIASALVGHGALVSSGFQNGIDIDAVDSAIDMPTMFPISMSNISGPSRPRCRPGSGAASVKQYNVFAIECFMDELARKAGRIRLSSAARCWEPNRAFLAALNLAAEKSNWANRCRRVVGARPSVCSPRLPAHHRNRGGKPKSTNKASTFAPNHFGGRYRHRRSTRIPLWRSSRAA